MLRYFKLVFVLSMLGLAGTVRAQEWTPLRVDGGLKQWRNAGASELFRAKEGILTVSGPGQLQYIGDGQPPELRNFELRAEVLGKPGGKGGLGFHVSTKDPRASGGLEIRIDNSYSRSGPGQNLLKTGSLVWLRPIVKSVVPDDRWFSLRLIVQAPRVQVWVDKQLLVDYVEPPKLEAGPRLKKGTLAIRGHGGSGDVLFRNLQLKLLPESLTPVPEKIPDATDLRLARLREQAFPLVDFHTHLGGGLTLKDVQERANLNGIGAGIVVRAGQGLPVADDKSALAFLKSLGGQPIFLGLHAEGREWVRLFAPKTVAHFDYVFTDAMTITDQRGKRTRLWIKDEVDIPDPEAFMELLVKTMENILEREPIDFLASPTYLPEVLAKDYDKLWTTQRLRRVVKALARNDVALEINDTLRLPRPALIKMAKEEGVLFTFGTNHRDRTLGSRLEYCLRMIEECALTPDDIWAPKPAGQKPIQVRKPR